jgi:rhamnosyltransferase
MIEKSIICGGVVLLNPSEEVLTNICSYIDQVDRVFIVDNSDTVNPSFQERSKHFPNMKIIRSVGNRGIAVALNELAGKALERGYDFLLTMDQDSMVPEQMILSLIA